MNAPAGLILSKIIRPEVGEPLTKGTLKLDVERTESNVIEAAAGGAAQGVQLAINVAAMLMAFVALVALLNFGLQWFGTAVLRLSGEPLSLQCLLGQLLRPLTWVMGVPWAGLHLRRRAHRHQDLPERVRRLRPVRRRPRQRHRARRPAAPSSPPTPCSGSPTSPRSPSRSAASAAWRRSAAARSPRSGSAP